MLDHAARYKFHVCMYVCNNILSDAVLMTDRQTNTGQSRTLPTGGPGHHEQVSDSFPPQDSNPHHTAVMQGVVRGR